MALQTGTRWTAQRATTADDRHERTVDGTRDDDGDDGGVGQVERSDGDAGARRRWRTAGSLGVYAAAFGASFGAVAVSSGLSTWQAVVLSAVLCSGASQFAFVGVIAAGGAGPAAAVAAVLLGVRNLFYGPVVRSRVPLARWQLPVWGMMVIDETAAVTVAEPDDGDPPAAFASSAVLLYAGWLGGTVVGALLGDVVDTRALGLDAVFPVVLLALLWPSVATPRSRGAALTGATLAALLVPVAPAGVPAVAAATAGVAWAWRPAGEGVS